MSIPPKYLPIGAGAGLSGSAYDTDTWVPRTFDIINGTRSVFTSWPLTVPGLPELPRMLPS